MSEVVSSKFKPSSDFEYWWGLEGQWVEEPNNRRGGTSGVQRLIRPGKTTLYIKRQTNHFYRSARHPLGEPTIVREITALKDLAGAGVNVPHMLYGGTDRESGAWRGLLVTEELQGYMEIDQWYRRNEKSPWGEAIRQNMLESLAGAFKRMHRIRRLHGCCYAKHIYVRVDGDKVQAAFLDLEKSRKRHTVYSAAQHDLKQFGRHRGLMPEQDYQRFLEYYEKL